MSQYTADASGLTIVFHAPDYEGLQAIIGDLTDRFPTMDIKRFVRSRTTGEPSASVPVDRSKLTDRQLEVLATAYEMGYFDRPREANATEIAATLDITPSTFSEHLCAAQRKLLGDVFAGDR